MAGVDFEVFGVEQYDADGEEKSRWTKIGVAFTNQDSISLRLNALPLNGNLVLLPPKKKEDDMRKKRIDPFNMG